MCVLKWIKNKQKDAATADRFATFLAVEPCSPQRALAGISIWQRDAGGAVGTKRRGVVFKITNGHGLTTESSFPPKWTLAAADRSSQTWCEACQRCCFFLLYLELWNRLMLRLWEVCIHTFKLICVFKWSHYEKKKRIQRRFSYYTDEPESMHVPPLLQLTWRQGLTPHWPTLRPNAGFPKSWNFPSLLVRSCTSKMHPYKETHAAFRVMSIIYLGKKCVDPASIKNYYPSTQILFNTWNYTTS